MVPTSCTSPRPTCRPRRCGSWIPTRVKLSAYLDLDVAEDLNRLRALASEADVFAQGFRAGALERRGLGPQDLAALRPGIVYVSINCYGHVGPWPARPGWEQLAQTVTG